MKRHLAIINVLLITAAVYMGVQMFYKIYASQLERDQLSTTTFKSESASQDEPMRFLFDYDPIVKRNLFNTMKAGGSQPKAVDIESLQPTSLNLKLLGTVTGDEKEAYAVIQEARKNEQQLYKIGDVIQNATLKMILREKVVLHVNGKDEVLEIEEASIFPGKTTRYHGSRTANSQNITLERSQIHGAVKDINQLMQQVRVRPHFTNGKPDGLRLTQIKPNSIFYNMGIKNGDVIIGVNNNKIASVDDALKLYQSLQASSSVRLQVKRRGQMKTIDYDIK